MANTILIGAQWGDEGKGKIIDFLTDHAQIVVRSQGGNNAGHTVIVGNTKYVLHLIPSGILRPGTLCVIGNGVVLDPMAVAQEIEGLRAKGIAVTPENLMISDAAHLVLPYHRQLDEARELAKGSGKIGTTKRGIGPAYGDKIARVGLRMADLMNPDLFAEKLAARVTENNQVLAGFGLPALDGQGMLKDLLAAGEALRPFVRNTVVFLHEVTQRGGNILFEGAQGTFLDIDHGTYPFVTSSNTTSGGACTGSGVPPNRMDKVIGVLKAYTTRVGGGPLPTESAEVSDLLHGMGREFGSTTGRARRCGWFDAVATRHATMVNGIDELAITNIDGLDSLKTLQVCVAYRANGQTLRHFPADHDILAQCEPVYETFPGWQTSTEEVTRWEDLPVNCRNYLLAVSQMTGARLTIASVGPARAQTMFL